MKKRYLYLILCFVAILVLPSFGCAKKEEANKQATATVEPVQGQAVAQTSNTLAPTTTTPAVSQPAETTADETAQTVATPSEKPITEERVLFSFENDLQGWEIPEWALDKEDHVATGIELSDEYASEGKFSMKINCAFPGGIWSAAVVELEQYLDFSPYRQIAVDIYIPKDVPQGLRAKIILTVGESWAFTEMNRSIPLVPGEWVTIVGNIEPGSFDWKRTNPDETFRQDVRKIVFRIESNRKPVYSGPIYIDNVRLGK